MGDKPKMFATFLVDMGRTIDAPTSNVLRKSMDAPEQLTTGTGGGASSTLNSVFEEISANVVRLEFKGYSARCAGKRVVCHARGHCMGKGGEERRGAEGKASR